MNNAAHWFTVMSFIAFFNIWVSNALQDFISDYGVRKNITVSQRTEHNKSAYTSYYSKVQKKVDYIDKELKVQPIMKNSQIESLNEFIENFVLSMKMKNMTGYLDASLPQPAYIKATEVYRNDVYNKPIDIAVAKRQLLTAIERVEKVNLKSYDFDLDPDNTYIN